MQSFQEIFDRAAERKGGAKALEALLETQGAVPKSSSELAAIPDDRWLSEMSRRVFQAGFNWKVIDNKWPGFEEVFEGFQPTRWALMSDEDLDRLLRDTRIVRHAKKILSVRDNAVFMTDMAKDYGTAAKAFADWPAEDYVGLLTLLKKRASRLGGTTAQYFLRGMGKESFVLSRDVTAALIHAGVIDKAPSSQKAMAAVQEAFTLWRQESGRSLTAISRVLAMSIDG